eukprot:4725652-Ditylum_brightwellii.AAC.1
MSQLGPRPDRYQDPNLRAVLAHESTKVVVNIQDYQPTVKCLSSNRQHNKYQAIGANNIFAATNDGASAATALAN